VDIVAGSHSAIYPVGLSKIPAMKENFMIVFEGKEKKYIHLELGSKDSLEELFS
jgi:hypothetical protein